MDQPVPTVVVEPKKTHWVLFSLIASAILIVDIAAGFFIGKYIYTPKPTPTPLLFPTPQAKPDPAQRDTADWKIYTITPDSDLGYASYSIKLPTSWKRLEHSSNFQNRETFQDGQNIYQLTIEEQKNVNVQTNKPFVNLREFTGLPYDSALLTVGGETATRYLPRAGSENIYKASFFSKDTKLVYSITLDTPNDGSRINDGQTLFTQILSTFVFNENKPLNSTFNVTLPDPLQLMRSTENTASYGFDAIEYLVVTNIPTIKPQILRPSTECGRLVTGQYCLNKSEGTGQSKDIANVIVGGIPAMSFYISGGNDNAYHVVQTTQTPILEFKMLIAGGGLDLRFQKFLNSLKFL